MLKLLLTAVLSALVLLGCQREEEIVDRKPPGKTNGKNSGVSDGNLFGSVDKGESVRLSRSAGVPVAYGNDVTNYGPSYPSSQSYSNDYQYGYSYGYGSHNPFLAFADYIHWLDYSVMSVVRLQFGFDPSVVTIAAQTEACWNFTITSSNGVSISKIDTRTQAGYGSMYETTQNGISVQWITPGSGKSGVIFAVHSQDHGTCNSDPYGYYNYSNPQWYHSGSDPYQSGYGGYYGQNYYYYPPDPCAYGHQYSTLRVQGTVGACNSDALPYFDVDLSYYLNDMAGYMPYYSQKVGGGYLIQGRVVNFDGDDWYYPVAY